MVRKEDKVVDTTCPYCGHRSGYLKTIFGTAKCAHCGVEIVVGRLTSEEIDDLLHRG